MLNLIKQCDNFGTKVSLTIDKSLSYKTFLGGCVSLFIYLFAMITCYFIGKEMWEKRKPVTNTSTFINPTPKSLNYHDDFEFSLGVRSKKYFGPFIDTSIYTVESLLFQYNKQEAKFTITKLNMEECSDNSFSKNHLSYFKEFPFENFWCLSKTQNLEVKVEKLYGQDQFKMLSTRIIPCVNSTLNNNSCSSQEEINAHLDGTFVSVNSISNVIQPGNLTHPFQTIIENYFTSISFFSITDMTIFLREVEFQTDYGIFMEDIESLFGFTSEKPERNFLKNDNYMFALTFQLYNKKDVIIRFYYKMQTLLAQIGGLINFCNLICTFLFKYYNNFEYYREIISQTFEKESFDKSYMNSSSMSIVKKNDLGNLNLKQKKNIRNTESAESGGYIKNFTFIEYICAKLCKSRNLDLRKKNSHYDLMKRNIHSKLEVGNILKLCYDQDKLKFLVLDDNQQRIFDMIPKLRACFVERDNNENRVKKFETEPKIKSDNLARFNKELSQADFNHSFAKILEDPEDKINKRMINLLNNE